MESIWIVTNKPCLKINEKSIVVVKELSLIIFLLVFYSQVDTNAERSGPTRRVRRYSTWSWTFFCFSSLSALWQWPIHLSLVSSGKVYEVRFAIPGPSISMVILFRIFSHLPTHALHEIIYISLSANIIIYFLHTSLLLATLLLFLYSLYTYSCCDVEVYYYTPASTGWESKRKQYMGDSCMITNFIHYAIHIFRATEQIFAQLHASCSTLEFVCVCSIIK